MPLPKRLQKATLNQVLMTSSMKKTEIEMKYKEVVRDQPFTELAVGVDPGLHGGIAVFDCVANKVISAFLMPTNHEEGEKATYDVAKLLEMLDNAVPFSKNLRDSSCTFCIERQHPLPEQGLVSTFTTGFGFGLLFGVFSAIRAVYDRIVVVRAQDWQKILWDEDAPDETKAKSIERVHRLFPDVDLCPDGRNSPSDGIADSVNIAHYAFLRMMDE